MTLLQVLQILLLLYRRIKIFRKCSIFGNDFQVIWIPHERIRLSPKLQKYVTQVHITKTWVKDGIFTQSFKSHIPDFHWKFLEKLFWQCNVYFSLFQPTVRTFHFSLRNPFNPVPKMHSPNSPHANWRGQHLKQLIHCLTWLWHVVSFKIVFGNDDQEIWIPWSRYLELSCCLFLFEGLASETFPSLLEGS